MSQIRKLSIKRALVSLKVFLFVSLALVLVAGLSACSEATITPTVTIEHRNYNYVPDITGAIVDQKWKSGDELKIAWKAQPKEVTTGSKPTEINLQLVLYGPAATKEEAEKLMANGNPVAQAPVLQTDSWSGQPFASTLILPPGLAPGTYQLVTQIEYLDPVSASRSQTTSSSAITVSG